MAWGSKVLDQISIELQNELPGLKGFSASNLKKMKVFAEFWIDNLTQSPIRSTVSSELQMSDNNPDFNYGEFAIIKSKIMKSLLDSDILKPLK